jgi:hypothetical protein
VIRQNRHRALLVFWGTSLYFLGWIGMALIYSDSYVCWLNAGFGLLCALVGFWCLLADDSVVLQADQFLVRTAFQRFTCRWIDVDCFGVSGFGPTKVVGFNFRDAAERRKPLRRWNRMLTGFDESIPDVFESRADDLRQLMSEWHSTACAEWEERGEPGQT